MKKYTISLVVLLLASISIWLGAAAPQWIQYSERVVGENSPFYDDVVNRPMKQIWANFTSQHTDAGEHKSTAFQESLVHQAYSEQQKLLSSLALNNGSFGSGAISPGKVFARPDSWQVFDTTTINVVSKGFYNGVFDGRYLYLIPMINGSSYHGQVTRYDTTGDFTAAESWSVFDTTAVNVNSKGFTGGVFDGRYLYMIPFHNGISNHGQVTRYDTTGNFTAAESWSVFDTTAVNVNSKGFQGGVFDGRYLYMVPFYTGSLYNGQVTRYDTTGNFTAAESWSVFDTTAVNANSKGFMGGIFDGRYLYMIPNTSGLYHGQVTRYDTTGNFTAVESWSVFDTTAVNANSKGFAGGVFDGRYLYMIPYISAPLTYSGQVTRYDTTGDFTAAESWSVFDTTAVNVNSKGFRGGVFDGRYFYLIPINSASGTYSGQVTRYDTIRNFIAPEAWSVFDTTAVNVNSKGFTGGVFDGRFLYMIPYKTGSTVSHGQVTRYDTGSYGHRQPVSIPTPVPTATPGPAFPTPLPTATPGPAFPTPLPTATPISNTVLDHPADDTIHDMRYPDLAVSSSPHTLSVSDGSCHGRLIITTATVTINLPSAADMTTYACHTLRVFVHQTSGATVINAGVNTYISSGMTDTIETNATPQGSYLEMIYSEVLDMWITTITRGEWTVHP